jgi:hypothetical protein
MMELLEQARKAAYEAAMLAENLWQDELERVYGNKAVEARYDRKRNAATPVLKTYNEARYGALQAWSMLGRAAREEWAA